MNKLFFGTLLLLIANNGFSATLPPPFSAKYEIKKSIVNIGYATRSLSIKEDKLYYISNSRTTGFVAAFFKERIVQTTQFQFTHNIVKPLTYTYDRNKGKKTVKQTYDWNKGEVFSQRDDKSFEYEIPIGAQDQNSYQLALMIDLSMGKRNFTYHIAENVRLVDYDIKYLGDKKITTLRGKLNTVVVQVKTKGSKITIWSAPDLHYLPVKIEHEEDGVSVIAELVSLKGI